MSIFDTNKGVTHVWTTPHLTKLLEHLPAPSQYMASDASSFWVAGRFTTARRSRKRPRLRWGGSRTGGAARIFWRLLQRPCPPPVRPVVNDRRDRTHNPGYGGESPQAREWHCPCPVRRERRPAPVPQPHLHLLVPLTPDPVVVPRSLTTARVTRSC